MMMMIHWVTYLLNGLLRLSSMETFIFGTDDIVTCPKCGSRTDFLELSDTIQEHDCLSCKYEFVVEIEETDE